MAELAAEAARLLRMREKDILSLRLLRRSVDAREEVRLVYTVEVAVKEESAILRRARSRKISRAAQAPAYTPPSPLPAPAVPPVVVGAGPAGLFAALVLAQAGLRPILLERGRPVERRKADVERFWATGELDLTSNVQFGEGGAGAFSDGKLNTGTRDPRHRFILETLLSCGAPEDILIDAKPHVGTDYLHTVLVNLRRRLLELGTDIRFESRLADLDIRDGALRGITAEGPEGVYTLPCSHLLLCPGHSARDKENINGGLLVNVTPEDYGGAEDPLAGIAFQRKLESAAYALGGGDYRAPAQRVGDFLAGRPSVGPGRVHPSYRPGVTWTDLRRCLPPFVADTIAGALPLLGQKLRGYDDPDAVLTAVESRSSSPVRIPRDGTCQSSLRGLYPCGEGAGYAGGILSAAADGMHCAEQLCQSIQKESDCL